MPRMFKKLLLLIVLAGILLAAVFAVREQPLVRSLPERVRAELEARGGTWVPLEEIPPALQQAIIATEDRSFYTNLGVSFEGIARSVLVDLISGSFQEGGSTITQELARNQLLTKEKTISRKLKEMVLALMITRDFSKRDILAMYLNSVYFGHGAYGVEAAARTYFGRTAAALSPAQCTLLAGLPQAPSYLDPLKNYPAARERQAQVLQSMVQAGTLDAARAREILAAPLDLRRTG